jgi:hypothetical protein
LLPFSAKITDWLAELLSTNMLRHLFLWVPISVAITGWADSSPAQEDRVAIARHRVTPILIQPFAAGLPYPLAK